MKRYCQKNYKDRLGYCRTTISKSGCYLTSIAMLAEIEPPELNRRFKVAGVYKGCLINSLKAAQELGMTYAKTYHRPDIVCIAETDHYRKIGIPQHFFVLFPDGRMIDPLDPAPKKNYYHIVSYRIFTKIMKEKYKKFAKKRGLKTFEDAVKYGYKKNKSENELEDRIKKLKSETRRLVESLRDELVQCREDKTKLSKTISGYHGKVKILQETIDGLEEELKKKDALIKRNAKDSSILDSLAFLLKTILNR